MSKNNLKQAKPEEIVKVLREIKSYRRSNINDELVGKGEEPFRNKIIRIDIQKEKNPFFQDTLWLEDKPNGNFVACTKSLPKVFGKKATIIISGKEQKGFKPFHLNKYRWYMTVARRIIKKFDLLDKTVYIKMKRRGYVHRLIYWFRPRPSFRTNLSG